MKRKATEKEAENIVSCRKRSKNKKINKRERERERESRRKCGGIENL